MNKHNGLMPIRSRKHNKKHTYFHYIGKMVNQVIQFFHVLGKTTHKHSSATARKHFRFRASHHHPPTPTRYCVNNNNKKMCVCVCAHSMHTKKQLFHLQQLFPWGCSLRIFWHHMKFHMGLHHRQRHRGDQSRRQGGALPWVNLLTSSVWKPTDYNFHCCWNDHTWNKQRKVQSKLTLLKGLFSR